MSSFYLGFEIADTMKKEILLQGPYYQSVKRFVPLVKLSHHLGPQEDLSNSFREEA